MKRTLPSSIRTAVILVILSITLGSCKWLQRDRKPNVILIITDDQGYGDIAFHGNEWIQTPNLDRLAEESFRLTDFHVASLCSPTRAGLLSGKNGNSVGVWSTVHGRSLLRHTEVTMADVFRNSGYRTGMFGKWHLGDNYPYRPQDRGFDEVFSHGGGGIGQINDYWNNDYFDDTYYRNGEPEKVSGYCTDVFFGAALDFIKENRDTPFFCYISTNVPHEPFLAPQKYIDLYKDNPNIRVPAFYAMITNLDDNLGILREGLDEIGVADNTILIFTTDNGNGGDLKLDREGFITAGFNAGMRGQKGSIYNGGHRVPFFLYWKDGNISMGQDVTQITSYTDILPTLIDLCELSEPEVEFEGKSIAPLIYGDVEEWPERIIITDQQWGEDLPSKGMYYASMSDRWHVIRGSELYDMEKDPGQTTDVAGQHPEIMDLHQQAYEEWWEVVSADFNDTCEIILDTEKESPICLHAMDWHSYQTPAWHQRHIRQGHASNGFWLLDVATAGSYEFAIRRWPLETGLALNASLPAGEPVPGGDVGHVGELKPEGISIEFTNATMKAGSQEQTKKVIPDEQDIRFTFDLEPGEFHLQTWLEDSEGITRGAYYVYVTRVD